MSFDVLATAAMADELQTLTLGGRVQQVVIVDAMSIGMEVYAHGERRYLYLSAAGQEARVHLVDHKLRRGPDTQTPLLQLLRKYVRGGRLMAVEQPSFDRILRFAFESEHGLVHLYAEIMGRHSNVILVDDDGEVMDAIKRVTPQMSRRVILPRRPYFPPPLQDKISYASLTPSRLNGLLQDDALRGPLWRKLLATVMGISPQLAREVVHRAAGDAQAEEADPAALLAAIDHLMGRAREGDWAPTVALERGQVVEYAPYPMAQFPEREDVATLSEAISRYQEQAREAGGGEDEYAVARQRWQEVIAGQREQLIRRQASIQRSASSEAEREAVMQKGQMILAASYDIQPGQTEVVVDWGEPVRIDLDPTLSPSENAQRYFAEYERLKAAAEQVPRLLRKVQRELAYVDQLETDLMLASNRAEIDQVREALVVAGYVRSTPRSGTRSASSSPGRYQSSDGLTIWVGRNSRQNEALTFGRAKPHDLWLHARNLPGSHVIVVTEGRDVPATTLQEAAELAAYHSKAQLDAAVDVDHVACRHVRRLRGGGPGMVTYRQFETIRVAPQAHTLLRLG